MLRSAPASRRARGLTGAAALLIATTSCGGVDSSESAVVDQPNIVVVMTDDQWLESMSLMENTTELVGDEGTTFTNAHVSNTTCCPSRATFLTGQYVHNTNVGSNVPDSLTELNGGYAALDGENTLAVWLEDAGYKTAHVGKYLNGYGSEQGSDPREIPPGWSNWYGTTDPFTYNYNDYRINENGELVCYGTLGEGTECDRQGPEMYQTDRVNEIAVDVIEESADGDQPFFLAVNPLAPHVQLDFATVPAPRHKGTLADLPPLESPAIGEADVSDKPSFIQDNPKASRPDPASDRIWGLETLLSVDEMVGDIVEALDEAGVLDSTVIIFTSDHGRGFGHHRLNSGKYYFYEEASAVPLLIRGGGFPSGESVDALVGNVDLAPTIAALADAEATHPIDGIDLLPIALDADRAGERTLLLDTGRTDNTYRTEGHWTVGVHTGRYVYLEHESDAGLEYELYDLDEDPDQLENVVEDESYADIRADLAKRMATLQTCAGSDCH